MCTILLPLDSILDPVSKCQTRKAGRETWGGCFRAEESDWWVSLWEDWLKRRVIPTSST